MSGKGKSASQQQRSTSFSEATNALRRAQRAIEKVAAQGDLIFPPDALSSTVHAVRATVSEIKQITPTVIKPDAHKPAPSQPVMSSSSSSSSSSNSNSSNSNSSSAPFERPSAPEPTLAALPAVPIVIQPSLDTHSVTRSLERLAALSPSVHHYVSSTNPLTYQQFLKSTLDAYLLCQQRATNGNYQPLPPVTFFHSSSALPAASTIAPTMTQLPAVSSQPTPVSMMPTTYPNTAYSVSHEAYQDIPYFQNIDEMNTYLWGEMEKVKEGARISFRRPYAVLATNCRRLDISLSDVRAQHGFSFLHFMVYHRYIPAIEILINATDKYTHIARNVKHESGNNLLHFCGLFAQPDQNYWNTQLNEQSQPVNETLINIVKLLSDERFADHVCLDVNETFYRHPDGSTHAHSAAMSGALDMLCYFHHHSTVNAFTVPRNSQDTTRPVDLADEHKHHHITQRWAHAQRTQQPAKQTEHHKRPHEGQEPDNRRIAYTSNMQGQQNIPQFIPAPSPTPEASQNTYLVGPSSLPLSPSFYQFPPLTPGTTQEPDPFGNFLPPPLPFK